MSIMMLMWNVPQSEDPQPEEPTILRQGFRGSKNPKSIALCIVGVQRTFSTSFVLGRLKRNLLDHIPADVFILTSPKWQPSWWVPANYSLDSDSRFNSSLEPAMSMIQPVFASTNDYVSWKISPEVLSSPNCSKNGIENWFWVEKCLETVSAYEEHRGYKYDWIMRFRTDIALQNPIDFAILSREKNATYSTFAGWECDEGIDDTLYISGRTAAEHSFRVIDLYRSCLPEAFFDDRPELCSPRRSGRFSCPWNFPNCALRASLVLGHLPLPKYIGTRSLLVRPCFPGNKFNGFCPKEEQFNCCIPNGTYDAL